MGLKAKITRALTFLILFVISGVGAAWRFSVSEAQDYPESQIELRADSAVEVGQPYVVDIYANVAAPAYGFGVQVTYDPSVLQLELKTDPDGTTVPMSVSGIFTGAQRIRNSQISEGSSATIDAVYTLLPPAEAITGEGFIGQLTFTVLQAAPSQVELASSRLIALDGGIARDLPVTPSFALSVAPNVALPQTAQTDNVPAPVVQSVEAAPAVQSEPVVQSIISTVDTPREILTEMNRTNTLMNTVTVGLLGLMTVLLGIFTLSSIRDAATSARQPQLVPARAYVNAYSGRQVPTIRSQQPQPPQRKRPTQTQAQTPRPAKARRVAPVDWIAEAPTIPSRAALYAHNQMSNLRQRRTRNTNDF